MNIPLVESYLPNLMPFIYSLAEEYKRGALTSWQMLADRLRSFYTAEQMDKIETVLPGWRKMSSYVDGGTLLHVTSVLISLVLLPEYQNATPEQQALSRWIILFHDIEKEIDKGQRDCRHAFRSAAHTGLVLPKLGFPVMDNTPLDEWNRFTESAVIFSREHGQPVHDNAKLPQILSGIEQIFGQHTPAALIIKTVLLHMSIDVVSEWPQAAPLTDDEIQRYVDQPLLPLLKIMMLTDNDAWAFFDAAQKQIDRGETLAVFEKIERMKAAGDSALATHG
jgi:hypothetical protein